MSSLGQLNINLSLEMAQFQQSLSKSEHQTQKFTRNFTVDLDKARASAKQFSDRTVAYLNNIEKAAQNINTAAKWEFRLNNIDRFQAVVSTFTNIADNYTELSNKLKLVSNSEIEHARSMAAVYDISLKTAQSTQAVSAVYQSFAQNAKELGISQQQIASVTETISKAVAISGASASEAQNALTQFSQTLLMGKMRAQEYNSIMTQTPAVMQAIARGLGITMAELKKMSDDGRLTPDKMIQGLEKSKASVDELYGKTATTVSGAMQNLSTATEKWVGELDKTLGVSSSAVTVLGAFAKNIDNIAYAVSGAVTIWGIYKGAIKTHSFLEARAAIYEQNKAIEAQKVAMAQAVIVRREEIATLAQETAVRLENAMQSYNANKATLEEIAITQQRIAVEKAKIAVEMQGVSSRGERIALSAQLKTLDQQEIQLTQQKILAEKELIATKKALKVAYAENAFTQSQFAASTVTHTVTTTLYGKAVAGVKNELNLMKAAFLSNPLMTLAMVGTTLIGTFWGIYEANKAAKEEALRYADSIDQVRTNLEQMNAVQTVAELVKVKQSIEEQEKVVADLRKEYDLLANEAKSTYKVTGNHGFEYVKSAKEISKAKDDLALKTEELRQTEEKLNKTLEFQQALEAHKSVAQIRDEMQSLFPSVEQSQIKVDGLNVSIGSFIANVPLASLEALKFSGAIGQIATAAINAAIAVSQLAGMEVGNEKLNLHLANNEAQIAINQAKAKGDTKRANQLQAKLNTDNKANSLGVEIGSKEYELLLNSELALLNSSPTGKSGGKKGGGKGKKQSEDEKAAKKAAKEAEKSRESYLNQIAEMSQRIANLKEEAANIALFGQTSQYQEAKKITDDIAINAEKYAGYGTEGIAKLKSLAADIDSEQQKVAIAGLGYDTKETLDAMQFELSLLGKTRTEQELIQFNHQLYLEAAKLKQGMTQENLALLNEEIEALKKRRAEIQAQAEEARSNWKNGITAGFNSIQDDVTNVAENVQNITVGAFNQMSDALTDFVMTGKADFRSMATSIMRDIANMIIKMMVFRAVASFMPGFGGIGPAGNISTSGLGSLFATGGYTGDGGKYTPAGIVHRGEYVITKEATRRIGLDYLNYLNYGKRGFASGGGVAVPRVPHQYQGLGNGSPNVTITVINNGKPTSAEVETTQNGDHLAITVKLMEQVANQVYQRNQTRDLRNGGVLSRH